MAGTVGAFFDLDYTLLAKSSGELYVQALRELGMVTRQELLKIMALSVLYRIGLIDPENVMDRFALRYKGMPETEMVEFCEKWFFADVKKYFYEEAVRKVEEHMSNGHVVSLLTASTPYVAEPTKRFLSLSHVICSRLEVEEGLLTGRIVKPLCHGSGKLYWARRFCEQHGVDLGRSYFYTDSIHDIALLEVVGHPRPVNPDFYLRRVARKRGWEIAVFSKILGD